MHSRSPGGAAVTEGGENILEEQRLVQETLAGQTEAFRVLVERYSGMVYNIAYGMLHDPEESKDAAQEIFYRAFRGLAGYRPEYPFMVWLRRIAVNYMLDHRKKRRLPTVFIEDMRQGEQPSMKLHESAKTALDRLLEQEEEEAVRRMVASLPPKYRIVVVLRHFQEMTYEEIAATLGCPVGTVMTRLHRARQRLADLLVPQLEAHHEPVVQT